MKHIDDSTRKRMRNFFREAEGMLPENQGEYFEQLTNEYYKLEGHPDSPLDDKIYCKEHPFTGEAEWNKICF